jgi:hypothetical protein
MRLLVPGASTERYQRLWHVGRTEVEEGILYGRLGFEGTGTADLWNDQDKDFEEAHTPAGVASPFAVNLDNLDLVFQTRGQDIRVTSFTGAMQGILRDASGEDWRVESPRTQMSFNEWRATVTKVTQMRFTLEPPNPNYEGRPDLERLIAGANLSAAALILRSDVGVMTDSQIVLELLDHVDHGYGSSVAVGDRPINGETVESVYSSELNGETEVAIRPANPDTGEVERATLRNELTEPVRPVHDEEHG